MKVVGYSDMHPVIPPAKCGPFEILHYNCDWRHLVAWGMNADVDWTQRFWREGKYVALTLNSIDGHETLMTDSDFERYTNKEVLQEAQGDVLIAGLGIGMLPYHLCRLDKVTSVTVLELEPDVIALVYPHIKHEKLRVILADANHPPILNHGQDWAFDFVYLDIWPEAVTEWSEIEDLMIVYDGIAPHIDAWLREVCEIYDTKGIAALPDEARPLSGWYLYPEDGSHTLEAKLNLIFGKEKD